MQVSKFNFRRNFAAAAVAGLSRQYLAPMGARHLCMEGEPGAGGGGGNGGGTPPVDPLSTLSPEARTAIEAMMNTRVEAAVGPLKTKNAEVIGEKRALQDAMKAYEGIDPEAVKSIMKRFGDDEEQSLIKAGKIDEVLNKRTDRLNQDWTKRLNAESEKTKKAEGRSAKLAERATAQGIIQEAVASGAEKTAMDDIVNRALRAGFTVDEDGEIVATKDGDVIYGKNGKDPLSVKEWMEELRSSAPHLWPKGQGANANGNNGGRSGRFDAIPSNLTPEQRITMARQQSAQRA